MVWYCMACIYFRLTGFIVQPMNLVTLAGRVQIQLLQTMQPLALGGALVPRGQNIKLQGVQKFHELVMWYFSQPNVDGS